MPENIALLKRMTAITNDIKEKNERMKKVLTTHQEFASTINKTLNILSTSLRNICAREKVAIKALGTMLDANYSPSLEQVEEFKMLSEVIIEPIERQKVFLEKNIEELLQKLNNSDIPESITESIRTHVIELKDIQNIIESDDVNIEIASLSQQKVEMAYRAFMNSISTLHPMDNDQPPPLTQTIPEILKSNGTSRSITKATLKKSTTKRSKNDKNKNIEQRFADNFQDVNQEVIENSRLLSSMLNNGIQYKASAMSAPQQIVNFINEKFDLDKPLNDVQWGIGLRFHQENDAWHEQMKLMETCMTDAIDHVVKVFEPVLKNYASMITKYAIEKEGRNELKSQQAELSETFKHMTNIARKVKTNTIN